MNENLMGVIKIALYLSGMAPNDPVEKAMLCFWVNRLKAHYKSRMWNKH